VFSFLLLVKFQVVENWCSSYIVPNRNGQGTVKLDVLTHKYFSSQLFTMACPGD